MCKKGLTTWVWVHVLAIGGDGPPGICQIDQCIAPIVAALNDGGIATAYSCCGHGESAPFIRLADGRTLAIVDDLSELQFWPKGRPLP